MHACMRVHACVLVFAEEAERFHSVMVTLLCLSLGLGGFSLPSEGSDVFKQVSFARLCFCSPTATEQHRNAALIKLEEFQSRRGVSK